MKRNEQKEEREKGRKSERERKKEWEIEKENKWWENLSRSLLGKLTRCQVSEDSHRSSFSLFSLSIFCYSERESSLSLSLSLSASHESREWLRDWETTGNWMNLYARAWERKGKKTSIQKWFQMLFSILECIHKGIPRDAYHVSRTYIQ